METKIGRLKAFCNDETFREKVLNNPKVQNILSILSARNFKIKYLLDCPTFDLEKSLIDFSYQREVLSGKKKSQEKSIVLDTKNQLRLLSNYLDNSSRELINDSELEENSHIQRNSYYRNNYITVISSITDFEKIRFLTFAILLLKILDKASDNFTYKPVWHHCFGGYKDDLRDSEDARYRMGLTNYLVLDNLDNKSTEFKLEKYRDLITLYPNSDIFILAAGVHPLDVCSKLLHIGMHCGLYLDEGLVIV